MNMNVLFSGPTQQQTFIQSFFPERSIINGNDNVNDKILDTNGKEKQKKGDEEKQQQQQRLFIEELNLIVRTYIIGIAVK